VPCRPPAAGGRARKIALFTNVQPEAVIECLDADSIYKIPAMLHDQMLDEIVCHKLDILARPPTSRCGTSSSTRSSIRSTTVNIAFVGKYVDLTESYKSLIEALNHAGMHTAAKVNIHYIDSEDVERRRHCGVLEGDGCHPGAGRLRQARYRGQDRRDPLRAREQGALPGHLPRHAARGGRVRPHVAGMEGAHSAPSSMPTRRTR
jgi:CTP synthase